MARLRPGWVAVKLSDAAAQSGVSPQRLSRLCSRAIGPFETIVRELSRIGRPPQDKAADQAAAQRDLMAALLNVATSLLSHCRMRRAWARSLVVGAWLRLKTEHPDLTQRRFCQALALSERTLRHWLKTGPPSRSTPQPAPVPPRPKKRPVRRGRFDFSVTIPDTQVGADTSDLSAFGQPLKLIATQDIGGRDVDLLDSIIVEDHESAQLVAKLLTEALQDFPGMQSITDQGTPYMSHLVQDVMEQLGADHAPQREGDPQGKATLERAFGTIKSIAKPLLSLTDRLAQSVEKLRNAELAKALVKMLLTALLRAYQAGARAAHRAAESREGLDEQALLRVAQKSRQQAHAEDKSVRLLLTHIHQVYQIEGSVSALIRAFRRFPLEVLQRAERAFGRQAHRGDIRSRQSYFAAIVRRINDEYQIEQAANLRQHKVVEDMKRQAEKHAAQLRHWADHPLELLNEALTALAAQWQPQTQSLLFDGAGLGRAWLDDALARLADMHGLVAMRDMVAGTFADFTRQQVDSLGPAGIAAIESVLLEYLKRYTTEGATDDFAHLFACAILRKTGPPSRPDPSLPLRT